MAARERSRAPSVPVASEDSQHPCFQGNWCHAATRAEDGTWRPALTYQPFCPPCRSRIAACLEELPGACVRMLVQIGQRPRTGKLIRVPPGPREPIRLEIDALIREMASVLGSWHERVAAVANLTAPDMESAVSHPVEAVRDAEKTLSRNLDALLSLPPGPMMRVAISPKAAEEQLSGNDPSRPWSDPEETGRVKPSGEAHMFPRLSGGNAGREILDLHHRARKVTGDVKARPEPFDGVPCRECEDMALEHAEPPSDPERPAMHSKCASCRHEMTREEFTAWAAMYRKWAESVPGLACRRCQKGDCAQCAWDKCACKAQSHVQRHAAA